MDDISTNPGVKVRLPIAAAQTQYVLPYGGPDICPAIGVSIPITNLFSTDLSTTIATGETNLVVFCGFRGNRAFISMGAKDSGIEAYMKTFSEIFTTDSEGRPNGDPYGLTTGFLDANGIGTVVIGVEIAEEGGLFVVNVTANDAATNTVFSSGGKSTIAVFKTSVVKGKPVLRNAEGSVVSRFGNNAILTDTFRDLYTWNSHARQTGMTFGYEGAFQWTEKVVCTESFVES